MSLAQTSESNLSEDEYLRGEIVSDIKHEYLNGQIYAMAGASRNHDIIAGNILTQLKEHLKKNNSPCDAFSSDMKVRVSGYDTAYFYP
ncbi:MAG: Uma2 family endonuclease [Gammaproteobacteria bacterium]|nr:Uma2 family endonuclease [Gammaproteobacteria bacterium]